MTFNIIEFNGRKHDYYIGIILKYDNINKTIKTYYVFQSDTSIEKREIAEKLKCDGVFITNIYSTLFDDINSNNYIESNK